MMALTACATVEEALPPDTGPGPNAPVTFSASIGVATRTAIDDERMVTWDEGDRITVFDSDGRSEVFTVTEGCSEFSFTSTGIIGSGPYYAVAGYGTDTPAFDKVNRQISIARPAVSSDGSFGGADLIASTTEGTSFTFHHVFAILKFSIASDDITSVLYNAEGISAGGSTLIGFGEDGAIVAQYDTGSDSAGVESIPGSGTYYLAVNPGTYSGFSILLKKGPVLMKAESEKGFTASVGEILNFGTLDVYIPESTVWQLVTNTDELNAGDEIIITASEDDLAMERLKNNYYTSTAISKSGDKGTLTEEPDSKVQRFTLTEGSSSGRFGLFTGTDYLGVSNTSLSVQGGVYNWTISVSGGIASIKGGSYNLRFNVNSKSFSLFPSSQQGTYIKGISIYKKVIFPQEGPQMSEVNAFLDQTDPGVYTYDALADIVSSIYTYCEGTDQFAVGDRSFRLQNLSEGKLAGITLDQSGTVLWSNCDASVAFYGITGYQEGSTRKTFTVRKAEDGKVWLLEENGILGFIINTK
ncbi:MAG: hypothetical protein J5374_07930 [Bacteroidales bacterium]|nr:hypothetical protein [Bacteroidales bacterium]